VRLSCLFEMICDKCLGSVVDLAWVFLDLGKISSLMVQCKGKWS
jgi:hypothetical protein